jgi:lipase
VNDVAQPLFVRSFGDGPRRVLALHCTLAHSGAWRGLAGVMDDEVTMITPDLLSHGRSPDWDGQGDFQDRCTDAVVHLLEPDMDIIGHSFGATVALRLAAAFPERVRSLTMIEPVFFAVALADAPDLVANHAVEATPYMDALSAGDAALAARLFNRMWSDDDAPRWPEMPETTRAAMTRAIHVVPAQAPSLFDDGPGMLKPGVLDRITAPTLLLRGSKAHPVISVINRGLARRLPNARDVEVDGAGHMLPISHPLETAVEWRRVLDQSRMASAF